MAHESGALRTKDLARVTVDTTVQPKDITFPTDAKLLHAAIKGLTRLARKRGVRLRQSYGPRPFDGACGFLRRFGWCGPFRHGVPYRSTTITAQWYCTFCNDAFCTDTSHISCSCIPRTFGTLPNVGLLIATTEKPSFAFQLVG